MFGPGPPALRSPLASAHLVRGSQLLVSAHWPARLLGGLGPSPPPTAARLAPPGDVATRLAVPSSAPLSRSALAPAAPLPLSPGARLLAHILWVCPAPQSVMSPVASALLAGLSVRLPRSCHSVLPLCPPSAASSPLPAPPRLGSRHPPALDLASGYADSFGCSAAIPPTSRPPPGCLLSWRRCL